MRVDVLSPAGARVRARYGLEVTPSFAFFDAAGQERLRKVGAPPSRDELDAILPPAA